MADSDKKQPRRATYEDLLRVPDHMVAEILQGELFASARPAIPHSFAAAKLTNDLGSLQGPPGSEGQGGWWILYEPELHFGTDVLVPDLAGWRCDRMARLPNAPTIELAPDWVCEILSPSTAKIDRVRKMHIFAQVRTPHIWLIDPSARTLEVYWLDGATYRLIAGHADDERVRAEPFAAIELDLARWWVDTP